ncbi:MAG: benzoate/H(+) symporter BenE family transporter [Propionibacteriaceae bacterium]|nr:benzoate/H(+) symporter BenE family transporter [Micropruina sp.]HBY22985.1 benzoate transporter [Propionibacteriaceae bacterium]
MRLFKDTTPHTVLAGFLTVVIGWAGPNVLIYSVQTAAGLDNATAMSWLWAGAILTGIAGIYLSLRTRQPMLVTWSTPGIAFLVTALPGFRFSEAIGAFLVSALIVTALGFVRPLTRMVERLPVGLAAALNAAILMPFAFHALTAATQLPVVVGAMIASYFIARQLNAQWAVAVVLVVGLAASAATGSLHPVSVPIELTIPQFVMPEFTWRAMVSLAIPLSLLAFTGQFLPGTGVLRANGYEPDLGRGLRACGLVSIPAALVGCHNLTMAALLANVVSGPEADPDKSKRYTAAVWASVMFIVVGLFAGTMLHLMGILPPAALAALAGLALLSALGQSFHTAFTTAVKGSLAAPVVIAVALSGFAPFGIGSAFWGIVGGIAVLGIEKYVRLPVRSPAPEPALVPEPTDA